MLEAHDITVKYGARIAVSAVTLKLEPRQVTAIIGPNGAGKSTMLRTLTADWKLPRAKFSWMVGCSMLIRDSQ